MDIFEIMKVRHSVRTYNDRKIEEDIVKKLRSIINECNKESGLHIQLCLEESSAFAGFMARYGKFSNVNNYVAMIGKKSKELEEKIGYYGEKIVLKATELGLGTCWVGLSYSKGKSKCKIEKGEKLVIVISLGYFDKVGGAHMTKSIEELSSVNGTVPEWFHSGIEAVQLAPTALNQQKFLFSLEGDTVAARAGNGFYTKLDLGIAKYHFELGAGNATWKWNK